MLRRVVSVASILVFCLGVAFAEEIRGIITKVEGNKVTFTEFKGPGEKGPEQTLPVADNVKVLKGKFNKDTKQLEDLQPVEGGLKNEMFTKISEKGLFGTIVTDKGKITEIRVSPKGKKAQ